MHHCHQHKKPQLMIAAQVVHELLQNSTLYRSDGRDPKTCTEGGGGGGGAETDNIRGLLAGEAEETIAWNMCMGVKFFR